MAEKKKKTTKKKPLDSARGKPAAKKKPAKKKVKVPKPAAVEELKKVEVPKAPAPPPVAAAPPPPPKPKKEKAPQGPRYIGTGRRKEATAKVWLVPGKGTILVNGKDFSVYFCGRKLLEYQVTRPLVVTNVRQSYDVFVEAFGGGVPGQAGAVSLGIARALLEVSPDFRIKLKREGLLRRDPRMKERKKYGLKRARRAFQYTKR
jgi:small subunit ribosomal protein S9